VIALWPAIDLMGGKVVRLLHGDPSQRTVYPERAVEIALRFAREGADGLHVVDLDAAFGAGSNAGPIAEIVAASPVPVEVGGGLRDRPSVEAALASGVSRIVLGSLPFRDPALFSDLVAEFAERLVVALDCKDGRPTVHGWVEDAGAGDAASVAARLAAQGV
jgi:phosphoribosylformimino-5-aminoimidazole carboxamide ribotide isomerase